jgi:glyoxylase-like metal-dependent hydrolase (beta-lactamase superfamily II)
MKKLVLKSSLRNITGFTLLWMFFFAYLTQAQENVFSFETGSFTVTLLSEGQRQSGTNVLVGATDEMIKQAIPDGTYPSATNAFLVETNNKTILIDAGLGQKTLDNLATYGKKASDIDAVCITHFHGDHIGSLLLNNQKSYPNAKIYISKPEYDYYMSSATMNSLPENLRGSITNARNILKAYKSQLVIFTPNPIEKAKELLPGLRAVAAYGHTPGHTGFLIESEGQKLLFWGDLTHAMAIQMPFPEVAMTYDVDKNLAIKTRLQLLKYLADSGINIAGAHIPFPGTGYVRKMGSSGYDFILLCTCQGFFPSPK